MKARSDREFIRSTYRSNRFVLAELTAPHATCAEGAERRRPPVNLAFVLDRSGSMAGEKLRLAKLAVEQSIARLGSEDRFSVVVYDDAIDVVFPSTLATAEARRAALQRLNEVDGAEHDQPGRGLAARLRAGRRVPVGRRRQSLPAADRRPGQQGHHRPRRAGRPRAALRSRGVSTSTFGVGADFDEVLLQAMATAGGGNFYYIAETAQIADYITTEVGEALDVVARDVTLEIDSPDGVSVESLSPFPFTTRGGRTVVSLGALVAEQVVQVVLRLNFPFGEIGRETGAVLSLSAGGDTEVVAGANVSLSWAYADPKTNDLQPRDVEVDRAVARIFAARARQEATGLNRAGNFPAAQAALLSVAKRIRSYAGRDAEMRAVVAELERDASEVSAPMAGGDAQGDALPRLFVGEVPHGRRQGHAPPSPTLR